VGGNAVGFNNMLAVDNFALFFSFVPGVAFLVILLRYYVSKFEGSR